ncbi:uncharacterized protein LOC144527451 isoform X4 [Sander vitreus]
MAAVPMAAVGLPTKFKRKRLTAMSTKGYSTKIKSKASADDDDEFQQGKLVLQNINQLLNQSDGLIRKRSRAESIKKSEIRSPLPLQKRQYGEGVSIKPRVEIRGLQQACESQQLFVDNNIRKPSRLRRIRKTPIVTLNAVAALQRLHPVALESFTPSLEVLHFPERHGDEQRQAGGVLQRGDVSDFQDTDVSPEPTVVITPIQGLPQRGAAAAALEGESKESSETDHTSITP